MKSGFQDCYEVAGRLISTLPKRSYLVHGWIFSRKLKKNIKHAWVECDSFVYDFSNGKRYKISLDDYYREGEVEIWFKYSRTDALLMLKETKRFEWWSIEQRKKILGEESK